MFHRKVDVAQRYGVTERQVDYWRAEGLLPQPIKIGTSQQAKVRWTDEHLATFEKRLAALAADFQSPTPASQSGSPAPDTSQRKRRPLKAQTSPPDFAPRNPGSYATYDSADPRPAPGEQPPAKPR
jgi:hypothetical protein